LSVDTNIVVLITSVCFNPGTEKLQRALNTILISRGVSYREIDGSIDTNKECRTKMWETSGKRAVYPQVFTHQGAGELSFIGDCEMVQDLVESDDIPADILAANPGINTFTKIFSAVSGARNTGGSIGFVTGAEILSGRINSPGEGTAAPSVSEILEKGMTSDTKLGPTKRNSLVVVKQERQKARWAANASKAEADRREAEAQKEREEAKKKAERAAKEKKWRENAAKKEEDEKVRNAAEAGKSVGGPSKWELKAQEEQEKVVADAKEAAAAEASSKADKAAAQGAAPSGMIEPGAFFFSLEEIQRRKAAALSGDVTLDGSCLENYLDDDDFAEAFGLSKEEYKTTAGWKKTGLKKKLGLF
jgi:hypothetical protein